VTETVTVNSMVGNDSDGDPIASAGSITLSPLEIAPGNMLQKYGTGGDLTDVEFTVYLPLRVRTNIDTWTETADVIKDGDEIVVRGKTCTALVELWQAGRGGSRGGVAVLARSRTGKKA
jgi:hypothetical protein